MYFGGVTALVIGFVILAYRGLRCTHDWSMIISLIGWLALIKGVLILVWPKMMIALTKSMLKDGTQKIMIVWVLF